MSPDLPHNGVSRRLRKYRPHLGLLGTVEVALGAVIMAFWAAMAALWTNSGPGLLLLVVFSIGLHLATVDTGRHLLSWAATGWLLALIGVAGTRTFDDLSPLLYTIAGTTALSYSELVRLSYARRRNAKIDADIYLQAALGLAIVGTVAFITIALVQPVAAVEVERTWLWIPASVGAILLVIVSLLVLPTVRAPKAERARWQPGQRLTRHPETDDSV